MGPRTRIRKVGTLRISARHLVDMLRAFNVNSANSVSGQQVLLLAVKQVSRVAHKIAEEEKWTFIRRVLGQL